MHYSLSVNLGVAVPSAHFSGLESLDDFRVCTWISLHEFACRRARERTVWLCCASSFSRLMRGARSSVPCGESFLGLLVSAVGASPDEPTQVAICRWVQGFHLDAYIVCLELCTVSQGCTRRSACTTQKEHVGCHVGTGDHNAVTQWDCA